MSPRPQPAVVLLSGGVDSTTALAIATHEGYQPQALTFQYGQRHAIEVEAARRVARAFGVNRHVVAAIDLRVFGGSALTDALAVPKQRGRRTLDGGFPLPMSRHVTRSSWPMPWHSPR